MRAKQHPLLLLFLAVLFTFAVFIISRSSSNSRNSSSSSSSTFLQPQSDEQVSILIGVLTTASKLERRSILRMAYSVQLPVPGAQVTVRFVLGRPKTEQEEQLVNMELLHHRDLQVLDCKENLNEGKTFAYLDSVASSGQHFHYVMKTDDDSYVRLDNLVASLRNLSRSGLYYGYVLPCESTDAYREYMAGMGYLLSWDLVQWIHTSALARDSAVGTEDMLVGKWLDASGLAKLRVNKKPMFYDHPEFGGACAHELTQDTILVHQVKSLQRWAHVLAYFEGHRFPTAQANP